MSYGVGSAPIQGKGKREAPWKENRPILWICRVLLCHSHRRQWLKGGYQCRPFFSRFNRVKDPVECYLLRSRAQLGLALHQDSPPLGIFHERPWIHVLRDLPVYG
ncbi:hypothetical protein FOVG_01961 [Fusarium oxysporum f. sp. pisi HDV247]|uniref:Uncharacterized protein n=1 Tax=Fusarium oxysporum f. sp. pisi HDV247 TaxID=1080344 RepID=W9QV18_FUSOX|nr:hypothetical protein FOVG_01961 [Fusarium oxysporum f. sp. pisi HDV247]